MEKSNIILDQGSLPECSIYATLNCLERMNPSLNILQILEEMRPQFKRIMSHVAALEWFKKRGYIKDHVPYRYNPLTIDRVPIIARVFDVNWQKTGEYPYEIVPGNNTFAHYVTAIGKKPDGTIIVENSWGEDWGDNGLFYIPEDQAHMFSMIRRIII